jgi:hypothetical protein
MRSESDIRTKMQAYNTLICFAVLFVSRKSIDKELIVSTLKHGLQQKFDDELGRHKFSFMRQILYHRTEKKKNWTCLNGAHKIYTPMCRASWFIGRKVVVTLVQCEFFLFLAQI